MCSAEYAICAVLSKAEYKVEDICFEGQPHFQTEHLAWQFKKENPEICKRDQMKFNLGKVKIGNRNQH